MSENEGLNLTRGTPEDDIGIRVYTSQWMFHYSIRISGSDDEGWLARVYRYRRLIGSIRSKNRAEVYEAAGNGACLHFSIHLARTYGGSESSLYGSMKPTRVSSKNQDEKGGNES